MRTLTYLPDYESRGDIDFEETCKLTNPDGSFLCSVSSCPEPAVYVTKHTNSRQPLGHLYSRCQLHQDRRDFYRGTRY